MKPNVSGKLPPEARGKRVIVRLRNGRVCGEQPVGNALPNGWAADTTNWRLTDHPFSVAAYEIVGEVSIKEGRTLSGDYV